MDLDSLAIWARVIVERVALFRRVMPMAMDNLFVAQHRDTSSNCTILNIKAIMPLGVLEL